MNALTVSLTVPPPPFREYLKELRSGEHETTRVCSEDGCDGAALWTKGYYLAGDRRVRVWVCKAHKVRNPNRVLPTPKSIQAAFDAERKYREKQALRARIVTESDKHVSVKELRSTGHGKALPYDRVANFRWEPLPGSVKKKRGRKNASR